MGTEDTGGNKMNFELVPRIPDMDGSGIMVAETEDYGDGNYVTVFSGTTKETYDTYLTALEKAGFQKYADNGAGLAGAVYCATYVKNKWAVTVTYLARLQRTCIAICFDKPLSGRLLYKEEYVAGNSENVKTKLYMRELWCFGNSFVVQLKNGHFLISDGGQPADAVYLVEHLEALAPEGEKPVIEGWFISHGHMDHCGVFRGLLETSGLSDRICVEGIYVSIVGNRFYARDEYTRVDIAYVQRAAKNMKRSDGGCTEIYRPHTGERYYFSDISVDVVHTQEQMLWEEVTNDINDSSTIIMLNIEGQKCLILGDGENGCMKTMMATYDREYLKLDMMTLTHHGFNTLDEFTDYCTVKTLLVTIRGILPVRQANENDHLKESVEEYFSWGDGTKVLTFPYTPGSYESLPRTRWIYQIEAERPEQPNARRYWRAQRRKEVRTLRITDHGLSGHVEAFLGKIRQRVPMAITEDGMMVEFVIDPAMNPNQRYSIRMVDPTGWLLSAVDEEALYRAIDVFLDTAVWTDKGFTAQERAKGVYDE